ncbi:MAG TPA: hypothetical protein PLO53_08600, partial [Candidatus Hydrogenedentes bacterium]|nr:hypothetical protein [Candidatus Hydrogenedentota bacterium]
TLLRSCGGSDAMENDPVRAVRLAHAVSLLLMAETIESRVFAGMEETPAGMPSASLLGQISSLRREAIAQLESLRAEITSGAMPDGNAIPDRASTQETAGPSVKRPSPAPASHQPQPSPAGRPNAGTSHVSGTDQGRPPLSGPNSPVPESHQPVACRSSLADNPSPGNAPSAKSEMPARDISAQLTREKFLALAKSHVASIPLPADKKALKTQRFP